MTVPTWRRLFGVLLLLLLGLVLLLLRWFLILRLILLLLILFLLRLRPVLLISGLVVFVLLVVRLLLLLLLELLERYLEVVLGVGVGGVPPQRLLVGLERRLELLLLVQGVAQVVPGLGFDRRVAALDRPPVRLHRALELLGSIQRVAVVERHDRRVGRLTQRLQILLVRFLVATFVVEPVARVDRPAARLRRGDRRQRKTGEHRHAP